MNNATRAFGESPAAAPPSTASDADDLFFGGPTLKLQARLGLARPGALQVATRALLFVLVAWLPLLALAAVDGNLRPSRNTGSILFDFGTLARCAVAGPLLITGEVLCMSVLGDIARRIVDLCRISVADPTRLAALLASIRRWRESPAVEIAVVLLAFGTSAALALAAPASRLPGWHRSGASLSLAGWWYAAVSLPLLLMLILGWAWRLLLWTRLLRALSRIDLNLVAVHPDKAAGLGFVGYSLRSFCPIGAAFGAIVAGNVATRLVAEGATLGQFKYTVAGLLAVTLALFTAPLLVFVPRLLVVWRRGVREYGELASSFGRQFELEWFVGRPPMKRDVLSRGDFSAATDLYQVVDRVHDLRLLPVDLASVVLLAGATLLPFVPVVLIALPFDVVLGALAGLLQ